MAIFGKLWKTLIAIIKKIDPFFLRFTPVSLIFYYFYFRLLIKPELIFQAQQPVFYFDKALLLPYLSYPGGLLDYLALLLSQFYFFPVPGTMLLALVCWSNSFLVWLILRRLSPKKPQSLLLHIPGLLSLALLSQYTFPLSTALGWLLALLLFIVYIHTKKLDLFFHSIVSLSLGLFLYYMAGGFLWPFLLYVAVFQIFIDRRLSRIWVQYILLVIPLVGYFMLFRISITETWLYLLIPATPLKSGITPWTLYAYVFTLLLYVGIAKRYEEDDSKSLLHIPIGWLSMVVNLVLGLSVVIYSFFHAYPQVKKPEITFKYYAMTEKWEKLLSLQFEKRYSTPFAVCATNRALYHRGRMLDRMLCYPQTRGSEGLFLLGKKDESVLLFKSDLLYDLGFREQAEEYCRLAMSRYGENPWSRKRLVLLRLVAGNIDEAKQQLNMLKKTVIYRGWANRMLMIVNNDSLLAADPLLVKKRPELNDLPDFENDPQRCLELLYHADEENRMALEYLVAYYLFTWNFEKIVEYTPCFKIDKLTRFPRHVQEALVLYNDQVDFESDYFKSLRISKRLDARFSTLRKLLAIYRIKKIEAPAKLANSFGDTYWYYALYPPIQVVQYEELKDQVKSAIKKREEMLKHLVIEYEENH